MATRCTPADAERELSTMLATLGFTPSITKKGVMYSKVSKMGNFRHVIGLLSFPVQDQIMFTHLGDPDYGLELMESTDEGVRDMYESIAQVIQNLGWDFQAEEQQS